MNYPAIPREFFQGECFDAYRIRGALIALRAEDSARVLVTGC